MASRPRTKFPARLYGGLDVHQLLHERGVDDAKAARRIEMTTVHASLFGVFHERGADNVHGLHIRRRSKAGMAAEASVRSCDGGGRYTSTGTKTKAAFSACAQEIGELARRWSYGTLKAHHDDAGLLRAAQVSSSVVSPPKQGNEVRHAQL